MFPTESMVSIEGGRRGEGGRSGGTERDGSGRWRARVGGGRREEGTETERDGSVNVVN